MRLYTCGDVANPVVVVKEPRVNKGRTNRRMLSADISRVSLNCTTHEVRVLPSFFAAADIGVWTDMRDVPRRKELRNLSIRALSKGQDSLLSKWT